MRILATTHTVLGRAVMGGLALSSVLLSATEAAPLTAQAGQPTYYVETVEGGAKLLNLPADSAREVLRVGPNQVLGVYKETADYLEVEAPGGVPVWVFGKYLQSAGQSEARVLEVTGNRVSMRPSPNSKTDNYPLPQYLYAGERVWQIERLDAAKPMSEDWVKIWSPPGKHAYVAKARTRAIAASADGRALWNASRTAALDARLPLPGEMEKAKAEAAETKSLAQIEAQKAEVRALESINEADRLFEEAAAAGRENADFSAARAAYQDLLNRMGEGYYAERAEMGLKKIELHEDLARMAGEARIRQEQAITRQQTLITRLEEANMAKSDPLWGRYQTRGWVERVARRGEEPAWQIRWAGETQSELICRSGRYDLSLYEGFEVGVVGGTSRAPIPASTSSRARPIQFDVLKLEVISARPTK